MALRVLSVCLMICNLLPTPLAAIPAYDMPPGITAADLERAIAEVAWDYPAVLNAFDERTVVELVAQYGNFDGEYIIVGRENGKRRHAVYCYWTRSGLSGEAYEDTGDKAYLDKVVRRNGVYGRYSVQVTEARWPEMREDIRALVEDNIALIEATLEEGVNDAMPWYGGMDAEIFSGIKYYNMSRDERLFASDVLHNRDRYRSSFSGPARYYIGDFFSLSSRKWGRLTIAVENGARKEIFELELNMNKDALHSVLLTGDSHRSGGLYTLEPNPAMLVLNFNSFLDRFNRYKKTYYYAGEIYIQHPPRPDESNRYTANRRVGL